MPPKKSIEDGEVLQKALLVISERGPERFTLADVGKVVGLAPATLMQRFGSKQTLLVEAAKHVLIKMKEDVAKLKSKGLAWDEELLEFLSEIPEGVGSRQAIANSLGLLKLDMISPELHPIARELFEEFRKHIRELLGQGGIKAELASAMTWELDALRHGLLIQWTLSGEGSLQVWLKRGISQYLRRVR